MDIFLCPISKLKKKFWKLQLFHFFDSWEIIIYPPKIEFSCFFYGNRIFRGTFDKFAFFNPNLFYHKRLFVFFYFINEKKVFNKIFFHYKCSYKLSTVIQKILNFIQKLSNRSEKNQKNPEKSEKNPIFSLFFLCSQRHFRQKLPHHLS